MRNRKLPHMIARPPLIHQRTLQLLESPMTPLYWHVVSRVGHTNTKGYTLLHAKGSHIVTEEFTEVHHENCDPQACQVPRMLKPVEGMLGC